MAYPMRKKPAKMKRKHKGPGNPRKSRVQDPHTAAAAAYVMPPSCRDYPPSDI